MKTAAKTIVLLSTDSEFSYRILKAAHAARVKVHVLGNSGASGLRWSRYPASVTITADSLEAPADEMVAEINRLTERHNAAKR